jgi:hypothetical protein
MAWSEDSYEVVSTLTAMRDKPRQHMLDLLRFW